MQALQRAQSALAIRDIYLTGSYIDVAGDFLPSINLADQKLTAQTRHNVSDKVQRVELEPEELQEDVTLLIRFRVHAGIRIVRKGGGRVVDGAEDDSSDPEVCAQLDATFVAEYSVTDRDAADDEALTVFAEQNVLYHVWPYWREYAQSTLSRMRLPALMVGMYRPKVADKEVSSTDD